MFTIIFKWDGIRDFVGGGDDVHFDPKVAQSAHQPPVEICHTHLLKLDGSLAIIRADNGQLMSPEIELDFESSVSIRNDGARQPPRRDIQGHVPGMIDPGCEREPDFTHDLRPHVKGGARVAPGRVLQ